jgi:hypothetical protein
MIGRSPNLSAQRGFFVDRMILIIAIVLTLVAPAAAGEDAQERVTVITVRMIVGELRYDWTSGSTVPPRAVTGITAPQTIASLLGISPSDSMSAAELEGRRASAQERLAASGFFYSAEVFVTPRAGAPDGRLVTVRLEEGFLWRFGGGPYFASVGQDNVAGLRKSWSITAGYNLAGLAWEDDSLDGGPFSYRVDAFYSNAIGTGFLDYHDIDSDLAAGFSISPDILVFVDSRLSYRWLLPDSSHALGEYPDPTGGLQWVPRIGLAAQSLSRSRALRFMAYSENTAGISLSIDGGAYATFEGSGWTRLSSPDDCGPFAAARLSYGGLLPVKGGLPAYGLFDLAGKADRSVRSGYAPMDLFVSGFALASTEIGFVLPPLRMFSFLSLALAPFLFADAAVAQTLPGAELRDLEAFGIGLKISFDNPVFAFFSLSYGWNPWGSGRLVFASVTDFPRLDLNGRNR